MPIDTETTDSPGWWFDRLLKQLALNQDRYDRLDDYYTGDVAIPAHAGKSVREAYRRLMSMSRTNFAELIVEAVRQRMRVSGFRTGAADDELGDNEALRIWEANSLAADSAMLFRAQLSLGDAYAIVGGVDEEIGAPLITIEDPREVVTAHDPRRRRRVVAALKVFHDDIEDRDRAFLYLPGFVIQAQRPKGANVAGFSYDTGGWEWSGEASPLPEPARGVVPVVRFANRLGVAGSSRGEFEGHTALLDRINYGILSRVEIATLQAFRQRALKGGPTHDAHGNEIDYADIFSADPGAMWHLPETADLWESGAVDLTPHLSAHKDDIKDLAAVTFTPMYLFSPDAASGSAEGASLMREGLVFKADDRTVETGENLARMMSLAFLMSGDTVRARRPDLKVDWASTERFSLSERGDAASKAMKGGLSRRATLETIWGKTPQEIERIEADHAREFALNVGVDPSLFAEDSAADTAG